MSRRTKRNNRNNDLVIGGRIPVFYAMSIIFAGLYLFGHINQLQGTIIRPGSGYFNITNLLLILLGILQAVFPVLMVLGKFRLLKLDLYAISALYAVGNLWFIRWLYSIIVTGNVSFDFAAYQLSWYNMFNHTTWASRNAETLLLNYLSAFLWYRIVKNIDTDKDKTCESMIILLVVTFLLPIIFFAVTRFDIIPEWWLKKSVTLFASYLCVLVVMVLSTQKKSFWGRFVCPLRSVETRSKRERY